MDWLPKGLIAYESIIYVYDDMNWDFLSSDVPWIEGVGSGVITMYDRHI